MRFLDPRYFGTDQPGARLDSAMVAVHARMLLASLASWIFEQQAGLRQMYVEMRVSLNSNAKAKNSDGY